MESASKVGNQGTKAGLGAEPESMSSEQPEVSVVIPCLNEANSIAVCIDKAMAAFRTAGIRGEVVVADNGSTDGSGEIAREQGLNVGAILTLAGGSAAVWLLWKWIASGFGRLYDVRVVIFLSLCFLVGVQVIFTSFFISMLGISRGTYIGDYDRR